MPYFVEWVIEDDNDTFQKGTDLVLDVAEQYGLSCDHSGLWLLGTKKRDMELTEKDTTNTDSDAIETAFEDIKANGGLKDFDYWWADDDGEDDLDDIDTSHLEQAAVALENEIDRWTDEASFEADFITGEES